jgi:glycosyltransferase involved in cell wall biosynthesis
VANPDASSRDRVLFVQWAGDYREAYNRLQSGGKENYYAQRYSLDRVSDLVSHREQIGVLCCYGDHSHDEVLANGVRSMNAGLSAKTRDLGAVIRRIEAFRPTHMIITTPKIELMHWSLDRGVEILGLFADSFVGAKEGLSPLRELVRSFRHRRFVRRLARLLNDPRIRWVSNHHIGASLDLVRIGVDARKVVPWHWPAMIRPESYPTKAGPAARSPWQLCFVGAIMQTKGLGDAIEAVAILRQRGRDARLTVIGGGEIERYAELATARGVADAVTFEGCQGNDRVMEAMASSHLVLVLSHHANPEAMPLVIQESLSTRTPLICSDHPMFVGRVSVEAGRIVPERSPAAVAAAVERILGNPALYQAMSLATRANFDQLQAPPRWDEVFNHWLGRTPADDRWLSEHSIASADYERPRAAIDHPSSHSPYARGGLARAGVIDSPFA